MKKLLTLLIALFATFLITLSGCASDLFKNESASKTSQDLKTSVSVNASTSEQVYASDLDSVPPFSTSPFAVINDNKPYFKDDEITTVSFERYSDLDSLKRCGITMACIGIDIMPTSEREPIGMVKPTGWHTVKYDCVDGKYLYNRCHLIGFQLTGENANEKNLITGTRYLNVDGMLPFENMVADYVKETKNHVMYRVTPIYKGNNLVANGVLMEALSVEDNGDGICFNIYCYNAQPQITIDYATGESFLTASGNSATSSSSQDTSLDQSAEQVSTFILNTNTKKFHLPTCSSATSMNSANRREITCAREDLLSDGYTPCGSCKP